MTRLIFGVCFVVLVGSISHAADLPATAPATTLSADSDAVRLFRLRASESVVVIRLAASEVAIDAGSRTTLTQILDAHLRKVEAEVESIRRDSPGIRQVTDRGGAMHKAFAAGPLIDWSNANPAARQLIEHRSNLWMSISMTLMAPSDHKKLVAAAVSAGLPASREAEALEIVERAHQALLTQMQAERDANEPRIAELPEAETKALAIAVIQAEQSGKLLLLGRSVYNQLRALLQPDQFEPFDRALPRPGW